MEKRRHVTIATWPFQMSNVFQVTCKLFTKMQKKFFPVISNQYLVQHQKRIKVCAKILQFLFLALSNTWYECKWRNSKSLEIWLFQYLFCKPLYFSNLQIYLWLWNVWALWNKNFFNGFIFCSSFFLGNCTKVAASLWSTKNLTNNWGCKRKQKTIYKKV